MMSHEVGLRPRRDIVAPGDHVDHYQVVRLIGRGGMGDVFLARDMALGRKAALKVLRPDALLDQENRERFLIEARITATFNHPHIVTVYGVGEVGQCAYVALEYVEGETLRQRMRTGPPGVRESLRIIRAVADALAEAHRRRILHWDLKPSNVMIPRDGRLRVVDFGLARALADASPQRESEPDDFALVPRADSELESSTLRGTPRYMAPERWLGGEASEASDVWALGLIVHQLLVGEHPYASVKLQALVAEVCSDRPVPAGVFPPELPDELTAVLVRCVDKDPKARPAAAEVVAAVDQYLSWVNLPASEDVTPFRGLLPFTERHASMFFGRDAEVDAFVERMRTEAVLPVVGPSGAGKSSFVQAGVLPRLREAGPWLVVEARPGRAPFASLAEGLLRVEDQATPATNRSATATLPSIDPRPVDEQLLDSPGRLSVLLLELAERTGRHVLLFVDQLEELYTLVDDPWVRRRYMQAVSSAADDPSAPVRVVLTLRDDFLGRMAETAEARAALGHITVLRSPEAAALREILERPVRLVGYEYEDASLVDTMVDAVRGEAAGLPVLEFACAQLWQQRDRKRKLLTRSAYEQMGGVEGALARHSDAILDSFTPDQASVARTICLRLATPEGTRRVVPKSELLDGLGADGELVVDRLTNERVIHARRGRSSETADTDVELVHESLIRHWARFSRWLDESREEMAFLAEASQAADLWERRGRPDDEVWKGDALRDAMRMAARAGSLPRGVRAFLEAGEDREKRRSRRRRTFLGTVIAALVGVVALFAVLEREARLEGQVAQEQRQKAERRRAEAQREGAEAALARGQLLEARAKLRGSLESSDSAAARALWWRLDRNPLVWRYPTGAGVYDVVFSADGRSVIAAGMNKPLYMIDRETASPRLLRGGEPQVFSLAVSPDGSHVASGAWSGRIRIRDMQSDTSRVIDAHGSGVLALAFHPEGATLASGGLDGAVRLWDVASGKKLVEMSSHGSRINGLSWSPDGKTIYSASSDGTLRAWRSSSGSSSRVFRGHASDVLDVAVTPAGDRLLSAGGDGTVRVWRASAGDVLSVLRGHAGAVTAVGVSPDGTLAASGSIDATVRLWDLDQGILRGVIRGHEAGVDAVRFSPDGRHLASAGRDGTVRLWRLDRIGAEPQDSGHGGIVTDVTFDSGGETLVSSGQDATVRLWDVATGQQRAVLRGHDNAVLSVAFHPADDTLASAGEDLGIRLWDAETHGERKVLYGHESTIRCVRFHPSRPLLASASSDGTVRLWDAATGSQVRVMRGHARGVMDVAFSDDGRLIASAGSDGTVRVWETDTGTEKETLTASREQVWGVAWGPEGKRLAWAGLSGVAEMADTKRFGRRVIGKVDGRLYGIALSPDATWAAAPGSDRAVHLWHVDTGDHRALRGHGAELDAVAFSPNGSIMGSGADDGSVRTWDVESGRARWFSVMFSSDPPLVLTHRGWENPLDGTKAQPPPRLADAIREDTVQASVSHDDGWACTQTRDGTIGLWDLAASNRVATTRVEAGARRVVALPGACMLWDDRHVRRLAREGSVRDVASLVSSMDPTEVGVVVASRGRIVVLDADGREVDALDADVGVSSVMRRDQRWVVGYDDGAVVIVEDEPGTPGQSLLDVPSSAVRRMVEGPTDTLVVGFENGVVGVWDRRSGQLLVRRKLHGPVVHLALYDQRLVAVSALGQVLVEDFAVFYRDLCGLLREVWDQVGVTWVDGRLVAQPAPPGHACSRR